MIVLDTDHLSCLEWGSQESAILRERLAETPDRKIVVSIISYEEQMRGWMALIAKTSDVMKNDIRSSIQTVLKHLNNQFETVPFCCDWHAEYGLIAAGKVVMTMTSTGKLTGLLPGEKPREWNDTIDVSDVPSGESPMARTKAYCLIPPRRGLVPVEL